LQQLAEKSDLYYSSVRTLEAFTGMPSATAKSLRRIKETFELEGVQFYKTNGVHLPNQLCE